MLQNYFKIAWRNLVRYKGHTLINIGGLTLGFACSIMIYLFVQHHLKYDNFHEHPDRIYRFVTEEHQDIISYSASVPPGFAYAFRTEYDYAEKVAKYVDLENQLISLDKNKKLKEDVSFVEAEFFEIFNFPFLNSKQPEISEPNMALITESMAKKFFGEEDPINKTFQLEGKEFFTIKGILKDLPNTSLIEAEIFLSFSSLKNYSRFLSNETGWNGISTSLQCFTLLRPDQAPDLIEGEIQGFVKKYRPNSKNIHHYKLQALSDIHFDPNYGGGINPNMLWIFSTIGFFLLLMAVINFINISTAQSINRSREVGIRKVLGGLRIHLFWQFMVETFVISFISLLLGIGLCALLLPYFNELFDLQLTYHALVNFPFIAFALSLLVLLAILAGTYPGFLLAKIAPVLALKGKLSPRDAGGFITRKVLISVQFIISIVMIISTLIVNKQMQYAIHSDLGFDKTGIVRVAIPDTINPIRLKGLKDRISRFSAVEKVSSCFGSPGASENNWGTSVLYNNRPEVEEFSISVKIGDADYVSTFGLDLLAGRNFVERDTVDELIVNEKLAEKLGFATPQELLGKDLSISGGYINAKIVGVVANFHNRDFHHGISPIFIAPKTDNYAEFAIKLNMNNAKGALDYIEEEWSNVFPNFLFEYEFLDERVEEMYETEQKFLSLGTLFSSLAILIGCLGIYGMILFFVAQRTREIGIRKILGGSIFNILALITEDFLKLVILAAVIAIPLAWYFMRIWLQNYTYQTELSWWIFVTAVAIIMAITLLTISYQALKAATAKPINILRTE